MDDGEKVYTLWLGHEKIEFTLDEIKADPKLERELRLLERKKAECEIQFFHPHGTAKMGHDCGFQLVSMADYINDRTHTIGINCSPNQVGKTAQAIVKKILKLIPCDKRWPVFGNGIEHRDWQGARTLVVLGYDKGQLKDVIWPELQKWIPASELGAMRPAVLGGTREPAWDRNPRVPLRCGSRVIMLTYEQPASVCAGVKAQEVLADEQMPLAFFNELDQRGRTLGGVWWDLSFTPHRVVGRPDSGANSWLFDIWTGQNTRGHSIIRTRITVDDVPDHIYSAEQKRRAYVQWVEEPKRTGDTEATREGLARYYGLFQQVSGLYYPEIDPEVHFVDWTYDDIKRRGWTHYRAIDYGYQNPTAVGFWAVSPSGDLFMYDEYYRAGIDAVQQAPAIIEHCGNERKLVRQLHDKDTGARYDVYEEVDVRQRYMRTWLDWHSFQTAGGVGRPVSFFFTIGGLKVVESTKLGQEHRAQNLRAMLRIDPSRKHMVTGKPGAPRLYVSRKCAKFKWEWERCVVEQRAYGNESHNTKETKRNKNDHLIDQAEYFACASPRYLGDYGSTVPRETVVLSKSSGY
jgi:hypothetical protein